MCSPIADTRPVEGWHAIDATEVQRESPLTVEMNYAGDPPQDETFVGAGSPRFT